MLRRFLFVLFLLILGFWGAIALGCSPQSSAPLNRLVVGIVSYDRGQSTLERYEPFKRYLAEQMQAVVELEPAFNELRAVEQTRRQIWSLVFAPPGLAAIAISQHQYIPLFPLDEPGNRRSVIVVRADSTVQTLGELAHQTIALGEPGSAAGYYLPLYDFYGLTFAEVRFAPTPRTVLAWLNEGEIAAGALSEEDFQRDRSEFGASTFRVLHQSRVIPVGSVLLGPTVERNQQQQIEQIMKQASSQIATDAGYLPSAPVPDYRSLIQLVQKVRPLEAKVREKPAVLTVD